MTDGDVGTPAPVPASPKERRLKLVLIASLALNLLVVGAVAGSMVFGKHSPRHSGARGDDYGLMGFTRELPSERRAPLRKAIREQREVFKPLREDVERARREAADLLVAEPFSKDSLKSALDKITEADVKLKTAGQGMFLTTAESLTPDERRSLREWWLKRQGRFARYRDDKPPKSDEPAPDK